MSYLPALKFGIFDDIFLIISLKLEFFNFIVKSLHVVVSLFLILPHFNGFHDPLLFFFKTIEIICPLFMYGIFSYNTPISFLHL